MIQRKQTLFLLLSFIAIVICLCISIGTFIPNGMGVSQPMYNLWITLSDGSRDFAVWPLFVLLLLSAMLNLGDIFLYMNRRLQSKLCWLSILLCILWYSIYIYEIKTLEPVLNSDFQLSFAACLPLVAIILTFLAQRGIQADEKLVRSMDRIR